jgi:hypothetical protein
MIGLIIITTTFAALTGIAVLLHLWLTETERSITW